MSIESSSPTYRKGSPRDLATQVVAKLETMRLRTKQASVVRADDAIADIDEALAIARKIQRGC